MNNNQELKTGIPETLEDINKNIYLHLHLDQEDIFQLLHNEFDECHNEYFQIYGRFKGKVIDGTNKFRLTEVDLKLIHLNKKPIYHLKVTDGKLKYDNGKGHFEFKIETGKCNGRQNGIDKTIKTNIDIIKNKIIDIHVNSNKNDVECETNKILVTANGFPCRNMATFNEA